MLVARNPGDLDRLLINAILALSAFVTLHARMLSLANAGFMAIGAYTSAILAVKAGPARCPCHSRGGASLRPCGARDRAAGAPADDVYLAICTLGFGEVVRILIVLLPGLTGGATGANLSTGFPYEALHQAQTWMIFLLLVLLCLSLLVDVPVPDRPRISGSPRESAGRLPAGDRHRGLQEPGLPHERDDRRRARGRSTRTAWARWTTATSGSRARWTSSASRCWAVRSVVRSACWARGCSTALPILLRDSLGASMSFLKGFAQLPNILYGLAILLVIIFMPGGLPLHSVPGRAGILAPPIEAFPGRPARDRAPRIPGSGCRRRARGKAHPCS